MSLRRVKTLSESKMVEQLKAAVTPFQDAGVTVRKVSLDNLANLNLTLKHFLKLAKPIETIGKQELLSNLLTSAAAGGVIASASRMNLSEIISFLQWLKGEDGAAALRGAQFSKKLGKKLAADKSAGEGAGPADIAWASLYSFEQTVYKNEVKEARLRYDNAIAAIKLQIAELEEAERAALEALRVKHHVIYSFKNQRSTREFYSRAWGLLVDEYTKAEKEIPAKTDTALEYAVRTYSADVANQLLFEYCSREEVRAGLLALAEEHLKGLRQKKERRLVDRVERRLVDRLERLLAAATGRARAPPVLPVGDEAEENTDGEAEPGPSKNKRRKRDDPLKN